MTLSTTNRVVLVHDWLTGMRGGEKCLELACQRWPDASLFTLIHQSGSVSESIERLEPRSSVLNRLPGVRSYYRYLLPAMPFAAKWKIPDCDVLLSFSHCVAKAAVPPANVPHICYCFTPMRYAWHMKDSYFRRGQLGRLKAASANLLLARIREWDRRTADRVTQFVAISRTIQNRIQDCYNRPSVVIYPPVDTEFYTPAPTANPNATRDDYYLIVSALAPYKRFDLAIEACNRLGKKLIIIGSGQDSKRLHRIAGPTVHFLGWQSDEVIRDHLRTCQALLFPGEEDFGIVPVEAQACGTPVIAFGRGGATETVEALGIAANPTGILFAEQTVDCVIAAMQQFEQEATAFDPRAARKNAVRFRKERYETELFGLVEHVLNGGRDLHTDREQPRRAA